MRSPEELMQSLKNNIDDHVQLMLVQGVRKQNIEIELLHYIKKVIYREESK